MVVLQKAITTPLLGPVISRGASKSITGLQAPRTWSPRMNLSVIVVTYSQVCSMLSPRVSSTSASFKTGRVSPGALCRTFGQLGFFSDIAAVMLCLVMARYGPMLMAARATVLMVLRHS